MKNTVKKILALALVICSVFALASCSLFQPKPKQDLEKAAKNLEKAGYDVDYETYDSDNAIIVEYIEASDEDGNKITIIKYATRKAAKLAYENEKIRRDYKIDTLENEIDSLKYQMKKFAEDDEKEMYEKYIEELKEELQALKKEEVLGKSGKIVWYGSKDAVKATK